MGAEGAASIVQGDLDDTYRSIDEGLVRGMERASHVFGANVRHCQWLQCAGTGSGSQQG